LIILGNYELVYELYQSTSSFQKLRYMAHVASINYVKINRNKLINSINILNDECFNLLISESLKRIRIYE
jgi:hypothetical protein